MPKLLVQENGQERRVVDVGAEPVVVGRAVENAITIHDRKSSRKHCRFLKVGQAVFIEDMNSSNGTLLNGQPAGREELSQGDTVRIGDVVIVYYADDSAVPDDAGNGATVSVMAPTAKQSAPAAEPDSILEDDPGADSAAPAAEPQAALPRIVIENGALEGQEQELAPVPFGIGRKPDNALVLPDSRVSGHHCRVVQEAGRWFMEDLDSGNGIVVDGTRVKRHVLRNTERLLLGNTEVSFKGLPVRVVPGDATPSAVIQHIDSFDISEEDISRLAVAQAATPQSPLQWVWTLLFVAFLGGGMFFGYRLIDDQLAKGRVPHDPDNLIINNPSFETVSESGRVEGWTVEGHGGEGSVASLEDEQVRHGRRAARLTGSATNTDFVRLVSAEIGTVKEDDIVEFTGLLRNGGEGGSGFPVAGLQILWIARTADGDRVITESFSRLVRPGSGRSFKPLRVRARPPAGATGCKVAVFGWGRGTLDADDLSLKKIQSGEVEVEGSIATYDSIQLNRSISDDEDLRVTVRGDGTTAVSREREKKGDRDAVIRNLWFTSVLDGRYPFGQLLAVSAEPPSQRENGLVTARYAYATGARDEDSVEQLVRLDDQAIRVDFRLLVNEGAAAGTHGLVVELEPRAERAGSMLYHGGDLVVAAEGAAALDGQMGDEWVIGQGSAQVILRLSPAVQFSTVPIDIGRSATAVCLKAELGAPDYLLEVAISTVSTREEERIAVLGAQVREALESKHFGRALDVLATLENEFDWRDDVQDDVRQQRAAIRLTGERLLTELSHMHRDFKQYPAAPVKTVLRDRADIIMNGFAGKPQEQRAARIISEIDQGEQSKVDEQLDRSADDLLKIGEQYYQSHRNHLARYYFEWIIEKYPDSTQAEQASNLITRIEARR